MHGNPKFFCWELETKSCGSPTPMPSPPPPPCLIPEMSDLRTTLKLSVQFGRRRRHLCCLWSVPTPGTSGSRTRRKLCLQFSRGRAAILLFVSCVQYFYFFWFHCMAIGNFSCSRVYTHTQQMDVCKFLKKNLKDLFCIFFLTSRNRVPSHTIPLLWNYLYNTVGGGTYAVCFSCWLSAFIQITIKFFPPRTCFSNTTLG